MEDWALIRRLAAEGLPKARIAERLGISRNTVARAVVSSEPPKYSRRPVEATSFTPFEERVSAFCSEAGISRKTFYKWVDRYRTGGVAGLDDRPRRPRSSPSQIDGEIEEVVVGDG